MSAEQAIALKLYGEPLPYQKGPRWGEIEAAMPKVGLTKLRPKHLQIIGYYLTGIKRQEVAQLCDVTENTVTNVLKDPLSQEFLGRKYGEFEEDLRGLYPKVVAAVRDSLSDSDNKVRLLAADKWFRTQGLYKDKTASAETAEDVMQRILNLQINNQIVIAPEVGNGKI